MSNDRTHFVYTLYHRGDRGVGEPVYVGAGTGDRIRHSRRHQAKKLGVKSSEITVVKVDGLTRDQAHHLEISLIAAIGRQCDGWWLLNEALGGVGPVGAIRSSETRAKIGAAQTGRTLSPEHRAAVAAGLRGKTLSAETRAKLSAALRGRRLSAETRQRMSAAKRRASPVAAD